MDTKLLTVARSTLVKEAEKAIDDCLKMGESAYKEYGLATATLAQACATLALVKLLESVYANVYTGEEGAFRIVSIRAE